MFCFVLLLIFFFFPGIFIYFLSHFCPWPSCFCSHPVRKVWDFTALSGLQNLQNCYIEKSEARRVYLLLKFEVKHSDLHSVCHRQLSSASTSHLLILPATVCLVGPTVLTDTDRYWPALAQAHEIGGKKGWLRKPYIPSSSFTPLLTPGGKQSRIFTACQGSGDERVNLFLFHILVSSIRNFWKFLFLPLYNLQQIWSLIIYLFVPEQCWLQQPINILCTM